MNILLIGCGNIGNILLHIWQARKIFNSIIVVQPSMSHAHEYATNADIKFISTCADIPVDFRPTVIVLAVKPQNFHALMPNLSTQLQNTHLVSLLTGITVKDLKHYATAATTISRIMPNVAIKTGNSLNLAFSEQSEIPVITNLFAPTGKTIWLQLEQQLDALTPITGSGPAYFFLLAEILKQNARQLGISDNVANELVTQVLIGSASLATDNADFVKLKSSVTSKGGITEAALTIMDPGFTSIIQDSLIAAMTRLQELARENTN